MSQEFEKIVLEKLDNFEGRFDKIENTLDEHTKILNEHKEILNEHTEQFKMVRKDIYEINNKIIKSAEKMQEIEEVVEYNTKTIKKYNEENAKKIDVSLKAYEQLNSRVDMSKCLISVLKSKNFENDVRITALEDAIKQNSLTA